MVTKRRWRRIVGVVTSVAILGAVWTLAPGAAAADSVSDDAMLVAPEYAMTDDGSLVSLETGQVVTDPELVGTENTPPDPLAKTNGERFIPVPLAEASSPSPQSETPETSQKTGPLQNSEYGAYWGRYAGSPAFFQKDGTLFVQQAKGVIDVSEHQGVIDWSKARADGVEGAIIRIGYGQNNLDKQARRNISECMRLGIPFGVYLYSYASNADFASGEGRYMASMLKEAGVNPNDLTYPAFYDLEAFTWDKDHLHPTDPGTYAGIVDAWYAGMQAGGFTRLAVYSYTNYLNNELNAASIRNRVGWVADYGPRMQYTGFASNERGWQYTSSGTVAGIKGNVDLNAFGVKDAVPSTHSQNGWNADRSRWYDNGVMARNHAFYDPESDAWYWADADGSIAAGKDVFIPRDESDRSKGGKWVRFREDRTMVKGEDFKDGAWYYFDPVTGEMAKGIAYVPSHGGKWAYYDPVTGRMQYGEQYVSYDKAHTGWYYFDPVTGAMAHGDMFVRSNGGKWVRYDDVTGKMVKGLDHRYGSWYYFLPSTGAMQKGNVYVPEWNAWHRFDLTTGRG